MNDELERINKQISILKIKLDKLNYPNIKLKNKILNLETSYYKLKTKNIPLGIKKLKERVKNVFKFFIECKNKDMYEYLSEKEIINRKLPIYSFFNDIKDELLLKKRFQDECQIRYVLFSSYIELNNKNKNNKRDYDNTIPKYRKYQKYLTYVEDKELDKIRILFTEKLIEKNKLVIYSDLEKLGKNFSYYFYRILFNHFTLNEINKYFMEFDYSIKLNKNFEDILYPYIDYFIDKYELNTDEITKLNNFFEIYGIYNNINYIFMEFDSFFEANQFSKKDELKEFINMLLKNVYPNNTRLYINTLNPVYKNTNSFLQIDFSMNDEELSKYVINAKKYFETIQNDEIFKNSFNFNQQVKFDSLISMKDLTKKDKNRLLGDLLFIFDCKAIGLSNDFIYEQINHSDKLDTRKDATISKYANVILDVIHNNRIFSFISIL